jgi:tetratricopeptide (TPR) repeat protein/serine/threonine protein kinase
MNESTTNAGRVIEIFNEAESRPAGAEREQFLEAACGGDANLRAEVEQLLRAHEDAGSFLKSDAAGAREAETDLTEFKSEEAGERIGHYKLLQRIGEGGFGTVWMAEQEQPVRRRVALKILKPGMDSRQVLARFDAERQALAIMDHPNIATVYDGGVTGSGRPYFVMELVKGMPITEFCDEQHLTPRARLELFTQVCRAVQHAHQKGVIHRDLKPSNVLVAMHDVTPVVKVIDFGVAKALGQELTDKTMFTGFAQLLGTPLYMSPEQAGRSSLDVDTRTDIYSLGVLLYELLTGTTPFDRERFKKAAEDEIRRIIREEEPPRPSTRLSESKDSLPSISALRHTEPAKLTRLVRGDLDWIVMKALEKDRLRRYETAGGFAEDVQRYLDNETVRARQPSLGYRLRKFVRRNKAVLAVAALVLLFLVLLGSGIGWTMRDKSARQTRVSKQVAQILTEVDEAQRAQQWPKVLAGLRRAEAALSGGEADPATEQIIRYRIKDVGFIDQLERISMERTKWLAGKFDDAGAGGNYAGAFREYGVDVMQLPVAESIVRLQARPALGIPVAAALDDWADAHREATKDTAGAERLVAVARGIDREPLRDAIRSTWGKPGSEARDELRRLAEKIDVRGQQPATLGILAGRLDRAGESDFAIRLLRDAQSAYPQDFWNNYNLAHMLETRNQQEEAIQYYTAAVSVRPNAVAARNNLAISLVKLGRLDEAIEACNRAIEIDPKFAKAHMHLGIALAKQGKAREALAAYRKAIEIDPKNAGAWGNLGLLFANSLQDLDQAVECCRKATELDPTLAEAHCNLGIVLAEQGKAEEAIASYRKAIELAPKDARYHFNLGIVLKSQGKLDEAVTAYQKAAELEPENATWYVNLGSALLSQREPEKAIAAFRKAVELAPKDSKGYVHLGAVLLNRGKAEEALVAWRKAVELNPGNAKIHGNIGAVLLDQIGDLEGAVESFHSALKLEPNNAGLHGNLGLALNQQGKTGEAIAAFRRAIELNPKGADFHMNLGVVLCNEGDYDAAVQCQRTAIELDPKYYRAHFNLGTALEHQGKLDEALAAYRKSIGIEPKFALGYFNVAWLLATRPDAAMRDPAEALKLATTALQLEPGKPDHYQCLGVAYYRSGNWKAAVAALERSVERRDGGDGCDWFFLAMANWQLKNKTGARRWYDQAVKRTNRNGAGDEELARFQKEAAELLQIKP